VPEQLRGAGYSTAAIGKWHLGYAKWAYTPTGRGFDSHVGYLQGPTTTTRRSAAGHQQTDYYNKTLGGSAAPATSRGITSE
jgi:arylsulfatase A-like enzyme